MSLDCLFILWVYSFELPSTSSTHCPEREAENGSAYTWKDPSRNLKSMGDQSSDEAETKASRGSYANYHAYQISHRLPAMHPARSCGSFFSICNKNCWLENFAIDYFSRISTQQFCSAPISPTQTYVQEVTAPHRYI